MDNNRRPKSWLQGARPDEMPEWIAKNPKAFRLLYEFASRSRRQEGEIEYRGELIHLKTREFITGRESTPQKVGLTEWEYRRLLKKFEKLGYITSIKKPHRFTIGTYLADGIFYNNPTTEQPTETTIEHTTDLPQPSTIKKEKKVKKKYENVGYLNNSSLNDITDKDLLEISNSYKVSLGFVKLQLEKLQNYCKSSGKIYKDYNAALRNFVLKDIQAVIERRGQGGSKHGVDARDIE